MAWESIGFFFTAQKFSAQSWYRVQVCTASRIHAHIIYREHRHEDHVLCVSIWLRAHTYIGTTCQLSPIAKFDSVQHMQKFLHTAICAQPQTHTPIRRWRWWERSEGDKASGRKLEWTRNGELERMLGTKESLRHHSNVPMCATVKPLQPQYQHPHLSGRNGVYPFSRTFIVI